MNAVDNLAAELGTSTYEVAAAALLAASGCTVRQWNKRNVGRAWTEDDDWGIAVPRPRGPVSFGVFAHEIGHHMLHRYSSEARWLEEVEAENYALAAFDVFKLKGRERYEAVAVKHLTYAFAKAIKRSRRRMPPTLAEEIAAVAPAWWERAKRDGPAWLKPTLTRAGASTSSGASGEEE